MLPPAVQLSLSACVALSRPGSAIAVKTLALVRTLLPCVAGPDIWKGVKRLLDTPRLVGG